MIDKKQIKDGASTILNGLGIKNWETDENFKDTPKRIADAFFEVCGSLNLDTEYQFKKLFESTYSSTNNQMIVIDKIREYSICPHHLFSYSMDVKIGYIPQGKVIGLSKLPRLVKLLANKPVLQETLTEDIANALMEYLVPLGCGVIVKAHHGCISVRGVKQIDAITTTSIMKGCFLVNPVKLEFLSL